MSHRAVALLDRSMVDAATATLAVAFHDDPMFEWVLPDRTRRRAQLTRLNRVALDFGMRYGRVTQTDGGRGVAIWVPPGESMTLPRLLRCGMLAAPFQVGFGPMARFAGANAVMDKVHASHVSGAHWQLLIVAVDPDLQGTGRGAALVREGLEQADTDAVPCYLDTSQPANLPFYERLGFTVEEEARLGKGGPPAWGMLRQGTRQPG